MSLSLVALMHVFNEIIKVHINKHKYKNQLIFVMPAHIKLRSSFEFIITYFQIYYKK